MECWQSHACYHRRRMTRATEALLSRIVRQQIARPSPIRQIMKMAERQNILDRASWTYLPATAPDLVIAEFNRLVDHHRPRLVLFGAPDNPTSQILPHVLVDAMRARTEADGAWLAIDFAYKCLYFDAPPEYYAWSPVDHPHVIGIHSNSKWGRGLGRRLGWLAAAPGVVEAIERVQQCSLLCPDTLSQMTMTRYLSQAIDDGSLATYVARTNEAYKEAARATIAAVDEYVRCRRLEPMGGLYTVSTSAPMLTPSSPVRCRRRAFWLSPAAASAHP